MPPVAAAFRAREILFGVGEKGTGNVCLIVEPPTECEIGERVPAIDDDPGRVVEMLRRASPPSTSVVYGTLAQVDRRLRRGFAAERIA